MAVVARIVGYSLLTAGLGAGIGAVLFANAGEQNRNGLCFVLACLGTLVGVIAGAAGEIVAAQRRLPATKPIPTAHEAWD